MEFKEVIDIMKKECLTNSPSCRRMGSDEQCPFADYNGRRLCDIFTGLPVNAWISDIEAVCKGIQDERKNKSK